jgi:hypothetical protein
MQPAPCTRFARTVRSLRRENRQVHALAIFEIEICSGHCGGRNSAKQFSNKKGTIRSQGVLVGELLGFFRSENNFEFFEIRSCIFENPW